MTASKGSTKATPPGAREPRTFDLDDIDPPDAVRIDGESYRLMRATGLSLLEKAALKRATARMGAIESKARPNDADAREYRKLAEEVVRIALPDAPTEKVAALTVEQLGQAIVTFFGRTAATSKVIAAVREMQISVTPSRDSSASTAATP